MTALILFFFLFPLPFLLWNIIDPRGMWEKLSSWQFRDPEANEPSDAAFDMQRLISLISQMTVKSQGQILALAWTLYRKRSVGL